MINLLFYRIVKMPIIGIKILNFIKRIQCGETRSEFLRLYTYKKYNVVVGRHTYGGCFNSNFNLGGEVKIGRYCSFASSVKYLSANHPIQSASMSPYFYNKSFGFNVKDVERFKLIIGNDVWIGEGAIINSKCSEIGNGAVVGAGSVVTKSVPPYSIVVGNPATIVKFRFDNETIQLLEKSQWFLKEPEELITYYKYMKNPKMFALKIIEKSDKELWKE